MVFRSKKKKRINSILCFFRQKRLLKTVTKQARRFGDQIKEQNIRYKGNEKACISRIVLVSISQYHDH